VFTSSEAFSESIPGIFKFKQGDYKDLANKIIEANKAGRLVYNEEARQYVEKNHNLNTLISKILSFYAS
ncbi:MAG: hypothetical protein Q7R88_02480, partial [bacterium]|nr:hypothetical protein [bacterium]